jgi:hypothetical protein
MRAVAGINYYSDAIGFGSATGLAKLQDLNQKPLGIRFFAKTGQTCSNGAPLYDYINTIPKGELLGKRITRELDAMGLPRMQGLAPGIMEDAAGALNPMPLFKAASGSGYAACKKVQLPVGDANGAVVSRQDPTNIWVKDPVEMKGGQPHQTRWIFDKWISMEDYDATPKTEAPPTPPAPAKTEPFADFQQQQLPYTGATAGVLLALLALGLLTTLGRK